MKNNTKKKPKLESGGGSDPLDPARKTITEIGIPKIENFQSSITRSTLVKFD